MATIRAYILTNANSGSAGDKVIIDGSGASVRSILVTDLLGTTSLYTSTAEHEAGSISNKPANPAGVHAAIDVKLPSGTAGRAVLSSATESDARTALGLGTSATRNVGTSSGTVTAGDDSRFNAFTGDSGSGGVAGRVPAPASGDGAAGKVLKASGGWGQVSNLPGIKRLKDDFGATANGVANDSAALAAATAAMIAGDTLDLQGLTYATTADSLLDLPDFSTVKNGKIKLTGAAASQTVFAPRGSLTALTYTGGAISAGATSLTNVSGLTSADAGKYLFVTSADTIATVSAVNYRPSEYVMIDSVSGTTVTLDRPLRFGYSTSPAVSLLVPKRNIVFDNVSFEGDPTKSQRGVLAEYCIDSYFSVHGLNMGHSTIALRRCIDTKAVYRGGNPQIETDNGTDYGAVAYDGCERCELIGHGYALRHVVASGERNGVDWGLSLHGVGQEMKDSVVDCHPGVMSPAYIYAHCQSIRRGGTLSGQAVGLTYQGGGLMTATVLADEWDSIVALVQPFHNTVDAFDIKIVAANAASSATRGLEFLVQKLGGSVQFIKTDVVATGMTNALSRVSNIDTDGSYSGLTITEIDTKTTGSAVVYGDVIILRTGHTITRSVQHDCAIWGITSGNTGVGAFRVGGTWTHAIQRGNSVRGAAGAVGVRADSISTRSFATGNAVYGVGGASITSLAVMGHTVQSGNDYT